MKVRFDLDTAQKASDDWNFNCGPGALCAILDKTPDEVRPFLLDFEKRGYTNPTLMRAILTRFGRIYRQTYRNDEPYGIPEVKFGLMRVQWAGPWTKKGVPMRARYRHTHWVAVKGQQIFDINAMYIGGWMPSSQWACNLVPWLIKECCPKGDGNWWPTHVLEVEEL